MSPARASAAVLLRRCRSTRWWGGDSTSGGAISADGSSTAGPFTTRAAEDFMCARRSRRHRRDLRDGRRIRALFAQARRTSPTPRVRSRTRKRRSAQTRGSSTSSRSSTMRWTNVVNSEYRTPWSRSTVGRLNAICACSTVSNWHEVDPSYPDVPLKLYGAGTDRDVRLLHGRDQRRGGREPAYTPATEDDNVTVQGVSGDKGGVGLLRLLVSRRTRTP